MLLRHRARNGAGESAESSNRSWSRDCLAIRRAGVAPRDTTGSDAVRRPRHAARGDDRVRAKVGPRLIYLPLSLWENHPQINADFRRLKRTNKSSDSCLQNLRQSAKSADNSDDFRAQRSFAEAERGLELRSAAVARTTSRAISE